MKKLVSLLLALCLWSIPAGLLAGGDTISWAEFLAEAQAALDGVKESEAVLIPSKPVSCYEEKIDQPLRVPGGKRLVVKDAAFEGFFLANGEVELRNVLIVAEGHHGVAIQSQRHKAVDIRVTIDSDCAIEARGERACAVGVIEPPYFGNDVSIVIDNAGTLRSDDAAIGLPADVDGYRTSKVSVRNTGTVSGGTCGIGISASAQRGSAHVEVTNEGTVTGGGALGDFPDVVSETGGNRCGIFVNATSVRNIATAVVRNKAGGIVRSERDSALGLYLYDGRNGSTYGGGKPNTKKTGSAEVINEGALEGAAGALQIGTPLKVPVPVMLSGAGQWNGGEAPAVLVDFGTHNEKGGLTEAEFRELANAYLDAIEMIAPQGSLSARAGLRRSVRSADGECVLGFVPVERFASEKP